ncbi:MAG: zinc ribbon domain-containing protein [bacterium]
MRCHAHPEVEAMGVCMGCGRAICGQCRKAMNDKNLCPSCFEAGPFDRFDFRFGFKDFGKAFKDFIFMAGRCPNCDRFIRHDFKVCPYCQTSLRVNCSECNRTLEPDWVVCPYCGQKR